MWSSNGSYDPQLMTKLHDSVGSRPGRPGRPRARRDAGRPPTGRPADGPAQAAATKDDDADGQPDGFGSYFLREQPDGHSADLESGHFGGQGQGQSTSYPIGYSAGHSLGPLAGQAVGHSLGYLGSSIGPAAGQVASRMRPYDHNCFKSALHHNKRPSRVQQPCRGECGSPGCLGSGRASLAAHENCDVAFGPFGAFDRPRVYHMYRSASADRARDALLAGGYAGGFGGGRPSGWRSYETLRRPSDRGLAEMKQALEHAVARSFQPPDYENTAWRGGGGGLPGGPPGLRRGAALSLRDVSLPGCDVLQRSIRRARDEHVYSSLRDVRDSRAVPENALRRAGLLGRVKQGARHPRPFRPASAENVLHRSLKDLKQAAEAGPPLWSFRPERPEPVYSSLDNVRLAAAAAARSRPPALGPALVPAMGRVPLALRSLRRHPREGMPWDASWHSHRGGWLDLPDPASVSPSPSPEPREEPPPPQRRASAPRPPPFAYAAAREQREHREPHRLKRKDKRSKYQHLVDDNNNSSGDSVVLVPAALAPAAAVAVEAGDPMAGYTYPYGLCPNCGQPPDVHVPPWVLINARPVGTPQRG